MKDDPEPLYFENYNLQDIVTPVDADAFEALLLETKYDAAETNFIIDGFRNGFDIGYAGPIDGLQHRVPNLKIRVGSEIILWNKVMKQVKLKRFAGPFENPPFESFIQSPIGLVPKDGGKDTRLIFHLLYPCNGSTTSINAGTPKEICTVQYSDFSEAVKMCMRKEVNCSMGKSDFSSAFRNLGVKVKCFKLLVLKAISPWDGKTYFFVDKCLPFGASISCSHFQRVSDAIAHIINSRLERT